ncbi:MAG: TonB-dependent receptor, partial [Gammaproteobacteria bacterium]
MKFVRGLTFAAGALASSAGLLYTQGAAAQQTAAQALLEEVVVTARRREESLEDLPLSVVAISGEAMQAQGIYNTEQIGEFAANVSLSSSDRMNHSRIFIRGIGGGFPNPVAVFGTGMYIDGHYLPGSLANYTSTVDIERVEVLRGPQGTLFGKNVTGGAVNIISAKPGPEFESSLTARIGDFGQQDLRGMINVPINDNLFFRGSISSEQSDGYYDNIFLGTNVDYRDSTNVRAAFRWTPGDNWTIDANLTNGKDRNGQLGRQCRVRPRPETLDGLEAAGQDVSAWRPVQVANDPTTSYQDAPGQWGGGPPGGHIGRLGPVNTAGQLVTNGGAEAVPDMWRWCDRSNAAGEFATAAEKDHYSNGDTNAVFVSANWDSGGEIGGLDNLQVRTNVSWRDADFNWIVDRDSSPLPIDVLSHVDEDDGSNLTTRNFEMIFDLDVNDRLSMLFGLYLFEEESLTGDGNCWPQWVDIFNFDTGNVE